MEIEFRKIAVLFLLALLSLILPNVSTQAANSLDIVINEVAWMGTTTAYQDEWIELYNNTDSQIDLAGWLIKAVDGTPEINLTGTVPANGYYLLERTDDTTLPDITADQVYAGAFGNNGEYLQLFDDQNNLIDEVNFGGEWPAGDNTTKQTMERINPAFPGSDLGNWQTSQNPGGTPKGQNSTGQPPEPVCEPTNEICDGLDNDCDDLIDEDLGMTTCGIGVCEVSIESCIDGTKQTCTPGLPTTEVCDQVDNNCDGQIDEGGVCATPEPQPTEEPQTAPTTYPSGIFINEFLPSPEGPDSEGEWVEIVNKNNFEANLSGWQIQDVKGRIKTYTLSQGTKISPEGFLVLSRKTSKITLNNDGDGINLIQPDGEVIDQVSYEKAPTGQSYNRAEDGWVWSDILTPGSKNIIPTQVPEESENGGTGKSEIQETGQAGISQLFHKSSQGLFVLLIALVIAIFSGIIILLLKRKIGVR